MKRIFLSGIIGLGVSPLFTQAAEAQGTTTFVSNLGDISSGGVAVGSNSWLAADFITGTNTSGYALNSIQLAMADASGNPSGFTVTIDASANDPLIVGSVLGTLTGSANPVAAGTYTYIAPPSLTLSPSTTYYIVVNAGTAVVDGDYGWSVTSTPSPGYNSYHWGGEISFAQSSDGLNWSFTSGSYGQFALNATPAPEPGLIGLFALGGLLVGFQRWKTRSVL
jgi:hypothetical protein